MGSNGKIRVLHIVTTFAQGGPGHVIDAHVKNTDYSRFEITCCSMYEPPANKRIEIPGYAKAEHICLGMKRFIELSVLSKICRIIKERSIDIVHTHLIRADWYGRIAANRCNVPVVSTIHGQDRDFNRIDFGRMAGGIVAAVTRFTMRYVDHFIAVSQGVKDYLIEDEKIDGDKITVIYNGIDCDTFTAGLEGVAEFRQSLGISDEDFVVGNVAVLHPRKGLDYLIKAARKVTKVYPNTKFLLHGQGPAEKHLKKLAEDLGLKEKIIFNTNIPPSVKVVDNSMDIFVLPSVFDGLGIAVLEAAATEKPCVVTNISGLRETVENNRTGLIVKPRDSDALAEAINSLLGDEQKRHSMGKEGRRRILDKFSASKMAKEYEKIYLSTLKPGFSI